ncbi:MAG: hypothetical protein XD98_0012 [Microgenomates bacterium 39_6]|nr:MAG: hypothetical protein XD98_0012 [Microgenomates bacterium 39_6]
MEGGSSLGAGAKSQLTSSGGFRQTFGGSITEEHLDKAAAADSGHNEQLAQQSSVLGQQRALQEAAATQGANKTVLAQTPEKIATQPRAIAGLSQELLKRPAKDLKDSFQAMFNINTLLNIQLKTPEEQAKQKKVAARWQKLTEEEQAEAQRIYEANLAKKRQEEEAKEKEKQELAAQQAQELPIPKGRQTGFRGFAGMGSKQKAQTLIQRQRSTLSGAE